MLAEENRPLIVQTFNSSKMMGSIGGEKDAKDGKVKQMVEDAQPSCLFIYCRLGPTTSILANATFVAILPILQQGCMDFQNCAQLETFYVT